jgi:nickel-type superoxide dismutase maturation protease
VTLVVTAVAAIAAARAWFGRATVEGASMIPTFERGDHLLYMRTTRFLPGQLVVVPDPREPARLLVKRVTSVRGDLIEVRGDNEAASTDSRTFGPVPARSVRGRVVYRYAPAGRIGAVEPRAGRRPQAG